MTAKEAIDRLRIIRDDERYTIFASALEMASDALEKQIPKKPNISKEEYTTNYKCPTCGCRLISKIDGEYVAGNHYKYCYICGQAIDWNITEDE